jgi:hypothetical protein
VLSNELPSKMKSNEDRLLKVIDSSYQDLIRDTCPMIGDVNLFFKSLDSDQVHDADLNSTSEGKSQDEPLSSEVEVEIMIAGK